MASDRFVTWLEKRPTRQTLGEHLSEFFGTGFDMEWRGDRWIVSVPGSPNPTVKWGKDVRPSPYREERFLEVIPNKELDVLTRQADPLVNASADVDLSDGCVPASRATRLTRMAKMGKTKKTKFVPREPSDFHPPLNDRFL